MSSSSSSSSEHSESSGGGSGSGSQMTEFVFDAEIVGRHTFCSISFMENWILINCCFACLVNSICCDL